MGVPIETTILFHLSWSELNMGFFKLKKIIVKIVIQHLLSNKQDSVLMGI